MARRYQVCHLYRHVARFGARVLAAIGPGGGMTWIASAIFDGHQRLTLRTVAQQTPTGDVKAMNYRIRFSRRLLVSACLLVLAACATGCSPTQPFYFCEDGDLSHYVGMATNIEYPDTKTCSIQEVNDPPAPLTVSNPKPEEMWDLSLEDAVKIALENGKVMRSLGVRLFIQPNTARTQVTQTPEVLLTQSPSVMTVYEPALFETDPIFGVEGALSAFDAQLQASAVWDKHDEPQNLNPNLIAQFPDNVFQGDTGTFQTGITKTTATGAEVSAFSNTIYNDSNNTFQQTSSDWTQNFELGIKQPLLQGAGSLYNRIAGPYDPLRGVGTYLQYDGVIIARIRTDIRLADFEAGVRNFVEDVENAYWELYFAYRNLEATKGGRDAALQTWKEVHAKYEVGARGGEADKEAQSRAQYFLFRASLETALNDLYRAENRLRYMMGLAATDGRLIRPADEPTDAKVVFDWSEVHAEGLCRSVELRQEKWRIKQMEMQLIASKNLLLPRLDVGGKYRFLGVGQDLIEQPGTPFNGNIAGTDAFSTLASGNYQEWELSAEFSMPIGFRQPLAAVRNAQLQLARERSILQDQELELSHQLADAMRDVDTNYVLSQTNFNRRVAAQQQVEAVKAAYDAGTVTLDLLLEAQRNQADAEAAYYRSLTDYNKAIMLVHYRKGSLLEYNGVYLAEGPWPAKAYFDAKRRARARDAGMYMDYGFSRPAVFSEGPFPQFQNSDGTAGYVGGQPVEASGEQISTPAPQQGVMPNNKQELPAPMPGPAATRPGSRLSPVSNGTSPSKAAAPGVATAQPVGQRSSLRISSVSPSSSSNNSVAVAPSKAAAATTNTTNSVIADNHVRQASAQTPFDWGDLSLNSPTDKAADQPSSSASNNSSVDGWKSTGSDESDPSQPTASDDRPTSGWKRSQR
ncbi:MAG TPA: TolC family protein [Pirellulales bacterium]|nr:TolC family protein [Pirellulales bacterium]